MLSGRIKRDDTDDTNIKIGIRVIGNLSIGEEKKENAPGRGIDHFRATGDYAERFHQILGDKPNKITIVFPSNNPIEVCYESVIGRDKQGRKCAESDGGTHLLFDSETGLYLEVTDSEFENTKEKGIKVKTGYGNNTKIETIKITSWKHVLVLRFVIVDVPGMFGSCWQLRTSASASSIPNIVSTFDYCAKIFGNAFCMVPFDLSVYLQKSNKPGNVSIYPVLQLTPNVSHENALKLSNFKDYHFTKLLDDNFITDIENKQLLPFNPDTGEIIDDKLQLPEPAYVVETVEKPTEKVAEKPIEKATEEPVKTSGYSQVIKAPDELNPYAGIEALQSKIKEATITSDVDNALDLLSTNPKIENDYRILILDAVNKNNKSAYTLIKYLTGKEKLGEVTIGQAEAIKDWLNSDFTNDGFVPCEQALEDIKMIFLRNSDMGNLFKNGQ